MFVPSGASVAAVQSKALLALNYAFHSSFWFVHGVENWTVSSCNCGFFNICETNLLSYLSIDIKSKLLLESEALLSFLKALVRVFSSFTQRFHLLHNLMHLMSLGIKARSSHGAKSRKGTNWLISSHHFEFWYESLLWLSELETLQKACMVDAILWLQKYSFRLVSFLVVLPLLWQRTGLGQNLQFPVSILNFNIFRLNSWTENAVDLKISLSKSKVISALQAAFYI